jgi:aspartyl-tRNA(Asn)/glutamyl-tRNA(Gln) amidotransferase subunit C
MSEPTRQPAIELSRADVQHLARLARLSLTDDEIKDAQQRLGVVLAYMDVLARFDPAPSLIDQASLTPTRRVITLDEAREDVAALPRESTFVTERAPRHDGPFVEVPKVIGEGAA